MLLRSRPGRGRGMRDSAVLNPSQAPLPKKAKGLPSPWSYTLMPWGHSVQLREQGTQLGDQEYPQIWFSGIIVVGHVQHAHLADLLRPAACNQGQVRWLHDHDDVR